MQKHEAKNLCQQHKYRYVLIQLNDGTVHDGIIESVDDDYVYLAIPVEGRAGGESETRAFGWGYPYYGYPYYGYFPYGGYPYYPRRRFYRGIFPLVALTALSLLPYY
ncbi:hypothetical protein [Paenibacillus sp. UNC499MF]|uniref:hypothetical protein n=1 Tax=Paenibacillus sp. UNC499MF TaxID=1502751 RepID=UPI0008A066C1|nr:hypothetical protein [Paenibacillus sp. UNC499MF]SEF49845.1 hypothetical protein SAMN02799616_00243 [Paenibacillus sp. UNC499MF]